MTPGVNISKVLVEGGLLPGHLLLVRQRQLRVLPGRPFVLMVIISSRWWLDLLSSWSSSVPSSYRPYVKQIATRTCIGLRSESFFFLKIPSFWKLMGRTRRELGNVGWRLCLSMNRFLGLVRLHAFFFDKGKKTFDKHLSRLSSNLGTHILSRRTHV